MKTPMKNHLINLFLLPALIAVLNLILAGRVTAQTFTTLHSFAGNDRTYPNGLILSGSTLYGTRYTGGILGGNGTVSAGTVFAVNTDGSGYTNLHRFTAIPVRPPSSNSDGAEPVAGLILTNNTLYGTAF